MWWFSAINSRVAYAGPMGAAATYIPRKKATARGIGRWRFLKLFGVKLLDVALLGLAHVHV